MKRKRRSSSRKVGKKPNSQGTSSRGAALKALLVSAAIKDALGALSRWDVGVSQLMHAEKRGAPLAPHTVALIAAENDQLAQHMGRLRASLLEIVDGQVQSTESER